PAHTRQSVRSNDAELLLNLVRLRYNDSMLFLGAGGVVAQYSYDASLNLGGTAGGGTAASGSVGTALAYGEKPTITYTPLTGEEFAQRLLAPIPIDSVMLFEQGGWSADRLLLVTVQRVNDVFNAPTAGGPTPSHKPDYEAFADLAERLERLREAGLMGVNWEQKEHETDVPGRNPRFWIRQPANPRSPLAADVAAVRRALDLEPGRDEFVLTSFPYKRQPSEVGLRCRSLLGVLYFLSQSVEVPAKDVQAGRGHCDRGRLRAAVRLVPDHPQGHDHPFAAEPPRERLRRRPAPWLVVLHRRRRQLVEGHLGLAEHPLRAAIRVWPGEVTPPDAAHR